MNYEKNFIPFLLLLLGFAVFIFSFFDIFYGLGLIIVSIAGFGFVIFFLLVTLFRKQNVEIRSIYDIDQFEKTLKGGLYHFKCPECKGVFAIKKSKSNDSKPMKMTCPDCGVVGYIPKNPRYIEEDVPEKKSLQGNFRCDICGEGITIWAEGTNLFKSIRVYSCPFCGRNQTMCKI